MNRTFVLTILVILSAGAAPLRIDVSALPSPPVAGAFHLGTTANPDGHTIIADSYSLLRDGQRWLPMMGEFHYSRYPDIQWRDELLKMKAGGVDIVSTYIFWIHHEEVEGQFDWTGQRDLRKFLTLCAELKMPVLLRIGPWDHGEVRNGGFPDWLLTKGYKLRSDDAGYLAEVQKLYQQISQQLTGLLWKNGGPVIGIQVENEYGGNGEHLLRLKQMAEAAGIDVPLYTRTGWPNLRNPVKFGELLPFYGDYAEGFWDRVLTPMPGRYWAAFTFVAVRTDTSVGSDELGAREAKDESGIARYPYLTCEIGGGMETSYHRRIHIDPTDVESTGLVKLGSGGNLTGFYVYHGGTNPDGKLSTLEESQETTNTNYNDMPVKSYDFQAPLGEFGQVRPQYHMLRRMSMFQQDFGPLLTMMPPTFPQTKVENGHDATTLRWSVRSNGKAGFIFINNYQRLLPMPAKLDVQFEISLATGKMLVPETPVTVPANSTFFWPFNLDLGGIKLAYVTAQPVCETEDGGTTYAVFAQIPDVPSEFEFQTDGVTIDSTTGKISNTGSFARIQNVKPGTGAAIQLHTADGKKLSVILLDDATSLTCWKGDFAGRDRILLTRANLLFDGDKLRMQSSDPADLTVAILPAPALAADSVQDGLFKRFTPISAKVAPVMAAVEQLQPAGPARQIQKGSHGAAAEPSDADFAAAAVWRIKLPPDIDVNRDLILRLNYAGDVARIYLDGKFLTDNFYNGNPFDLGLKRFAPGVYQKELLLKILPLRKDAPIYLPKDAWPNFATADSIVALRSTEVIETHEAQLQAK
jgi:beta-galactosidase